MPEARLNGLASLERKYLIFNGKKCFKKVKSEKLLGILLLFCF